MQSRGLRYPIALCAGVALLAGCGGHESVVPTTAGSSAEFNRWTPQYLALPSRDVDFASLDAQRDAGRTIPFFGGSIKSPVDGKTYTYSIAGADPRKSNATTNVLYLPIELRVKFADGTVLDPTKPACGDTVSVANRFFKGPNFVPVPLVSNGVSVGKVQITDGFQRAEFWKILKGPRYHTVLKGAAAPVVVDVTAPGGSTTRNGVCAGSTHKVGAINVDAMNNIIKNIAKNRAKPNQVAVFLTYNVFETSGGRCCVLGFHSAFGTAAGTQTYSIGAYNDRGLFQDRWTADIDTWTHEFGDLLDDPFPFAGAGMNWTPPWGGTGQVPQGSCQDNLETGDPLTGTGFEVRYNGFLYHPQELAFFSWFYRTPTTGTGGKFSFKGTFTRSQPMCFSQ